jgi:hypothetical protein
MFNVDDFFTVFKFYRDNRNVIGLEDEDKIGLACPSGTDIININNESVQCLNGVDANGNCIEIEGQPTSNTLGSLCPADTTTVINGLCLDSNTVEIDESIRQIAVDSKLLATQLFERTIDLPVHNNPDFNKLRSYFIDWYSSNRTFATIQRQSSDPQSLDPVLLEQAIRGFGFNYGSLIRKKDLRAQFLLSLAEIYKYKGSPQSIVDALRFFGFSNLKIYEWWATRVDCEIFFEGRKLDTGDVDDENAFPEKRILDYDDFIKIADPHWFYTQSQILNLDKNTEHGLIGLPSITPYFSLATTADIKDFESVYSILSRLIKDQYENFLNGDNVPQDLFIDDAGFSVSLVSLWMGIIYSWNNWNDWLKYVKLRDYIIEEFGIVPEFDENDPFILTFPNAYEKLLFWTITHTDENGDADPLDVTASGLAWVYPDQVDKITDLPATATEGDKILVRNGLSGNHEEWRYDGTDWQLIREFPNGLGTNRLPRSGIPFKLYPNCIEVYPDEWDVSGGRIDTPLDYDISIIRYDEQVFYPLLNNAGKLSPKCKYLHANDPTIPNYNQPFTQISGFSDVIDTVQDRFAEINTRPTDRDDFDEKFEDFGDEFTRLQSLNCIQNKYDPQRILQGLPPVATVADLPATATEGDTILVNSGVSGDPEVYLYSAGTWSLLDNGLVVGNLGLDQRFKDWIDGQVEADRFAFEELIESLLIELDTFSATLIGPTPIDLKQLAMGIPNIGTSLLPVLDFFKPKRARFLSYELIHEINDPVGDSINISDQLELTARLRVPHEGPDTPRGDHPLNYDEYEPGHDYHDLYDDVTIIVTEGGVSVPPQDWCCPTPPP